MLLWAGVPGTASARTWGSGLLGSRAAVPRWAAQVAGLGDLPSDQIRAMEQQVKQVLAEAQRQQDQLQQLRQRLAAAESANLWLPWLLLGWVVIGGLSLWMALRLRRLQAALNSRPADGVRADQQFYQAGPATDAGAARMVSPGQGMLSAQPSVAAATQPALTVAQPRVLAGGTADGDPLRSSTGTDGPLAPRVFSLGTGVPPRPVSVEELLDLDQQVEFFRVLGQEQAAIDLLLSHVRSTGGINALPYFKLLEIYRHQGDEEAYERTRERFNQRFNAQAPDWSGDLMGGRGLEDYPAVIHRLQQVWAQPARAVADLESLLLRRADLEPFDMPAYRDVLMLQALARDLPAFDGDGTATVPYAVPPAAPTTEPMSFDAPPALPGDTVDFLLPLDDGPVDITAQRPQVSERTSAQAMLAEWVFTRATSPRTPDDADALWASELDRGSASRPVPLDLDLSEFAPAPREFTRPAPFAEVELRRDSRLSGFGYDELDNGPPPLPSRH
jgi:hypothetical protein